MAVVADGRAQVLQAARENLRRGATQIKIAVGGGIGSYYDPLVFRYLIPHLVSAVMVVAPVPRDAHRDGKKA